ncbi:MAG TPA: RHS repeat-associated core domain-containing protein [Ktedonobacterales bacterium]|nr:RHS repeat-associated core domain-containing protein [Ktedonobacterales bacterium]
MAAAGRITGANLGNSTYSYSASYANALRLSQMSVTNTSLGTTLFATGRYYDQVNNVVTVGTTVPGGWENQVFCYDDLNRLTWAGSTGTIPCGRSATWDNLPGYTATYSYDPLNRITGGALGTLTFGDSAHLHGATSSSNGETASYDAAGEMICRAPTSATTCTGASPTGASLTYDAERRLKYWQNGQNGQPITSQVWFMYDGEGHRVEQYTSSGSGNHTYYLPGNVEEVTPSGTLVKYYAAGGLSLGVNTTTNGSGIAYLVSDGLGSVSEALNQTGSAAGTQLYSPYGGVRYSSGVMPTANGFTGQYSDAASTGLDYYGARYYDPALGQFTSADTVTDGLNRYGYVRGNPETRNDPSGHRVCYGEDASSCVVAPPPPSGSARMQKVKGWNGCYVGDVTCQGGKAQKDAQTAYGKLTDELIEKWGEAFKEWFNKHLNLLDKLKNWALDKLLDWLGGDDAKTLFKTLTGDATGAQFWVVIPWIMSLWESNQKHDMVPKRLEYRRFWSSSRRFRERALHWCGNRYSNWVVH